jgi:hypothetical protein
VVIPPTLFDPIKVGALELSHRVVMAPLTRLRSGPPGDVPGPLMTESYAQRASVGGWPSYSRFHSEWPSSEALHPLCSSLCTGMRLPETLSAA